MKNIKNIIEVKDTGDDFIWIKAHRSALDKKGPVEKRMARVFEMVAAGFKNTEIARETRVSVPTIQNDIETLKLRKNAKNRIQLALRFYGVTNAF